jgi:hypothetical protein
VDLKTGRATYGSSVDAINWNPADNAGDVPMFNLSWADGAAYADWAGLRPLTELEYEKMCRGTIQTVPNEYAWGSAMNFPISVDAGFDNINKANEVQTKVRRIPTGNYRISPNGTTTHNFWPMRVGAFATAETNSRMEAGATLYGAMNVNDNVAERYVNVSTPQGRAFTGLHGDGKLNGSGFANVHHWPGADSKGTGYRGFYNNNIVPVSSRQYADVENAARNPWDGFRGGRTSWGEGTICPNVSISQIVHTTQVTRTEEGAEGEIIEIVEFVGTGEITLVASGGITYKWSTGHTTPSIFVKPAETTRYTVTATTVGGCVKTENVTIIK